MNDQSERTFNKDFKRFFVRGLAVLLPSVLTLWLLVHAYRFVDSAIASPINAGVRLAMIQTARVWDPLKRSFDPAEEQVDAEFAAQVTAGVRSPDRAVIRERLRAAAIHAWWSDRWYLNVIGLLVAVVGVYTAGRLLGGYFGRKIQQRIERMIVSVPILKQVYPHVKRLVDFLFGQEKKLKFNRVVVVEYPRKGIWSVGFMTGGTMRAIAEHSGESVTVFIPSSPTPVTGYTITVPRRDVIDLPISVEEALMFVVSGGVLVPPHEQVEGDADLEADRKPPQLPLPPGAATRLPVRAAGEPTLPS
jgi:uncharacterized membrane protein